MTTTQTTTQIGDKLVVDGEIREIQSIKGRWVKLDDGTNISREDAAAGRQEYIEDDETLGDELDTDDDQDDISEDITDDADEATGYQGSMIRLRERLAQGAYKKAINGQPCCGDQVAVALGALTPAQVIRACIVAMALPSNPYTHLNIGQQSMNLRNKLRGCFKREEFGFGVLVEAVEQVTEEAVIVHVVNAEFAEMEEEVLTAAAE